VAGQISTDRIRSGRRSFRLPLFPQGNARRTKASGASVISAEVPVRWARDVVVPHPAANCVKHDPLKAVIVSNRPVAFAGLRECGHDRARQMQILLDKGEVGGLRQIETVLHLVFQWWAGLGPIRFLLQIQLRFEPHVIGHKDGTRPYDSTRDMASWP
jgi:hypothetical protein